MARKARRRSRHGEPLPGDPSDHLGFPRFLALFLEALAVKGYSPGTVNTRAHHLETFIRWASERGISRPAEVSRPVLERYQRHLFYYRKPNGDPLSFHTQSLRLVSLRTFFRWLTRQSLILYNPASELDTPRYAKRLPRFVLTPAEVEQILAVPDTSEPFGLRDRALLETLYATGMRRAEIVRLTLADIDTARRSVLIREGKGGKDRIVPICPRALAWLDRYVLTARPQLVTAPDDGFVFLTFLGQPFSPASLSAHVRRFVERADLGKSGACHLFRHSMATSMLENGADLRYLQEILGHAQITTTQLYTQVSLAKLHEVYSATHPTARGRPTDADAAASDEDTSHPRPALSSSPSPPAADPRQQLLDALEVEAKEEGAEDSVPDGDHR